MGKRERMEKRRVRKLESETSTKNASKSLRGCLNPESNILDNGPSSQNIGCPYLPTEMWDNILESINDIYHLWAVSHKVSRQLRKCVEDRVSKHLLRNIYVLFKDETTALVFDRLGSDTETHLAYFKHVRICPVPARATEWTLQDWQTRIRTQDILTEFVIIIDRYGDGTEGQVNDTMLPDLSFHLDKEDEQEISLDWRSLLDAFFREQMAIDARLKALSDKFVGRAQDEQYDQHFKELRNRRSVNPHEVKFRKEVRYERLRERYAKNPSMLKAIIILGFSHPFQTEGVCGLHKCFYCPSAARRCWDVRSRGTENTKEERHQLLRHEVLQESMRVVRWIFHLRKNMNKGNCHSKRYFKSILDKLRALHDKKI